jgi:hypothetical protein
MSDSNDLLFPTLTEGSIHLSEDIFLSEADVSNKKPWE